MEKVEPDNFKFRLGGFTRTSWQVSWEGGKLIWRKFAAEWQELTSEEIHPSDDEWTAFWSALDESQIWSWNEAYYLEAERACDQIPASASEDELADASDDIISWAVEVLLKDGRYIDSSGSNAVPGKTGRAKSPRNRRRRGGRSGRPQRSPEATEVAPTAVMVRDSNAGIPEDTFDIVLNAIKTLIKGKELGDEEQIPEAVETVFRGRTEKKRARKSPLELFEAEETETSKPKRRRRSIKRQDGSKDNRSEEQKTTRKKSRRRKKPTGEAVQRKDASQGENAATNPTRKRRRRRRKPANPENRDSQATSTSAGNKPAARRPKQRPAGSSTQKANPDSAHSSAAPQGDGAPGAVKKKRRRRRRRKPAGDGSSAPKPSGSDS